eukprot:85712_1
MATTQCQLIPLESTSSFSRCQLYYDFSRGRSQRIINSIFTENIFIVENTNDNKYINISNPSNMIASNSPSSFTDYSILLDIEFMKSKSTTLGYFWSADSTKYTNEGEYHREQYQFIYNNGEFGVINKKQGPYIFSDSMLINTNERHLIVLKSSMEKAELYIDGIYIGEQGISNYGVYSPYYIILGGNGRNRNFIPMKVYRYAFYSGDVTYDQINEMCNITNYNRNINTNSNINDNLAMKIIGFMPVVLIPLCVIMIFIGIYCIFKYKRQKTERLKKMRKKMRKKRKKLDEDDRKVDEDSNHILIRHADDKEECVICMHNIKEYICTPCGHFCLCKECKDKIKKCPLCQQKYKSIIKVFT